MITKDIIEKVKQENPGKKFFKGTINYQAGPNNPKTAEFIFRQPVLADAEALQSAAAKSPINAQNNLLTSLIVYPEAKQVMDELRDYTIAVGTFVDECINPFFGGVVRASTEEL